MGIRKFKFSKGFAKQEMVKRAAAESLDVYAVMHNKTDDVNAIGRSRLEDKFNTLTNETIDDVIRQEKQHETAKCKMYVLRLFQIKRREKILDWLEKYVRKMENKENKMIIRKYAFGLAKEYRAEIMNAFYDEFDDYSEIIRQLQCICGYTDMLMQEEENDTCEEVIEEEQKEETEAESEDDASAEDEEVEEQGESGDAGDTTLSAEDDGSEEPTTKKQEKEEKKEFEAFFGKAEDCGKGTNREN